MAIVKLRFRKNAGEAIRYVLKGREPDGPVSTNDCHESTAVHDFEAIAQLNKDKGDMKAVHIMQSWKAEESAKLSPEEFNEIGRELVERKFPGHAFLVVTHTDTRHTHNHIIVSPWHAETGKKIENKRYHQQDLRDISDELCKGRGLSVVNGARKDRQARLPEKVQKIARFNGKSWYIDLLEKADVARAYATSYDEYSAVLTALSVKVRVEDKSVTYFYGAKKRGTRGRKLGPMYDKKGLEQAFRENDQKFAKIPGLRDQIGGITRSVSTGETGLAAGKSALKQVTETTYSQGYKDYGQFSKTARPGREKRYAHERELGDAVLLVDELRRARRGNILAYAKANNIAVETNKAGKTVLKGRPFVELGEHEWTNRRNHTVGSLIEFVAAYKQKSIVQAVADINSNPRLLVLEQHFGEVKRSFVSFYVPKEKRLRDDDARSKIASVLSAHGVAPHHASTLHRAELAQVDSGGRVHLFGKDDEGGSFEFTENADKQWSKAKKGSFKQPIFAMPGTGKKAAVYVDPIQFMSHQGKGALRNDRHEHGVLALMEPNERLVDEFVAGNPHVKELHVFTISGGKRTKVEVDFFNNLKGRYQPLGIEVKELHGKELSRDRSPDLPSL